MLNRQLLTTYLRTDLETAIPGTNFGISVAPAGQSVYGILYSIAGGGYGGPPLAAPNEDAVCVYQVRSVGRRTDECEVIADRVRAFFLDRDPEGRFVSPITTPAGYKIIDRSPAGPMPGVDSSEPGIYSADERFALTLTPV